MNPTNVLFLFHFTAMGGAEQLVFDLSKHLTKSRFQPLVCCLVPIYKVSLYKGQYTTEQIVACTKKAGSILREAGTPVFNINITSIYDFSVITKLHQLIKNKNIDIIFCLDSQPERTIGLLVGALSLRSDFILSTHYDTYDLKQYRYFSLLDKILVQFAAKVTATSTYQKERLVKLEGISPSKIAVIYNGVDLTRFSLNGTSYSKDVFGIPPEDKVVGKIARLVPMKGHSIFLKAANHILDRLPDTHFVIVGDGPERPALEALCKELGIQQKVHFLGTRYDIPDILPVFDVAVLSSHSENLPISLLEYMATERAIVSTSVGGIPEVISDAETGLLVEPGDPQKLSNAISRLLTDSTYARRLAVAAKKRVANHFSIDAMVRHLEGLFDSTCHPHG